LDVAGGFQINYAFQLIETVAGRLYVEVPFILTGAVRTSAAFGQVSTSVGSTIFLTPGVRWKFTPWSRLSLYAAAGGGLASFDGLYASTINGRKVAQLGRSSTGAFEFGLGLDTRGNLDGAVHHSLVMFGAGLHF
jgi:hypothetical protein